MAQVSVLELFPPVLAFTFMIAGGKVLDATFCTSDKWVACLNSNDFIQLVNIETEQHTALPKLAANTSHPTDPQDRKSVV